MCYLPVIRNQRSSTVTRVSFVNRLRRDASGQSMVLAAIMLPVVIGFAGFAVDVGYAFSYKKQMQTAADSAAMAGAYAVKTDSSMDSAALDGVVGIASSNRGFTNGSGGIVVSVCRPGVDLSCPTSFSYAPADGAVKVTISLVKDSFFAKIFNFNWTTKIASAVASRTTTGSGGVALAE
jgi:uncharacterized membrane protein